jgi:aminoglycoside 3-N-acetyltransferase
VRGNHPLNSFSAIGPLADELIRTQSLLNVYGPLQALYKHPATYMVLIGVDLTKATPIHFAEEKAGRRLFRRWAKLLDGTVHEVAVGSCSEGFNNLAPAVKELVQ